MRATYNVLGTSAYILYMIYRYVESNSVLVADYDITSSVCRQQGEELHENAYEYGIADDASRPP